MFSRRFIDDDREVRNAGANGGRARTDTVVFGIDFVYQDDCWFCPEIPVNRRNFFYSGLKKMRPNDETRNNRDACKAGNVPNRDVPASLLAPVT